MKKLFLFAFIVLGISSCTEQQNAKHWGGNAEITLPKGRKLVNVTWKDNNLWYLTREMRLDETAESYTLQESSDYGFMEGTVTIREVR